MRKGVERSRALRIPFNDEETVERFRAHAMEVPLLLLSVVNITLNIINKDGLSWFDALLLEIELRFYGEAYPLMMMSEPKIITIGWVLL